MLACALASCFAAAPALGNLGYELATPDPTLVEGIEFPHGVAVDQASQHVYVTVVTKDFSTGAPGEIRRYESDGDPAGIFAAEPDSYFSGVAVNPLNQGVYGAQTVAETPFGNFGTARMNVFSSAGVLGTFFPLSATGTLPQIATDSTGDVYFPNAATDSIQVFDSAGALEETITCDGCPGGPFGEPASVAINSEDDLYVADLSPDRVVKFTLSAGSYQFDSILQSGRGAVAVGVDPSTDDVLVGDFPDDGDYHVVAYDSSGVQFDDFGAGLFIDVPLGAIAAAQIAADATTHRLYLTETNKVYIFEKVTIDPPIATAKSATSLRQMRATFNATVNANGHAVLECEFEYTDEADFQANGFGNAASVPCPVKPDGSDNVPLAASVMGLQPGTDYRYRVTATSNAGTGSSNSKTFKTLAATPPTVTTAAAADVAQSDATINGAVNPHAGETSDCHFELGTSQAYGSDFPCASLPGPVSVAVLQGLGVSGLAPGTTYHYRLVATTNAGTAAGEDVQFTTKSPPPVPEPEPEPDEPDPTTSPGPGPVVTGPGRRCKKGFRRQRVRGKVRCVKVCRKGFRRQRVRGKTRCVKKKHRAKKHRAGRLPPARVGRR